MTSCLLDVAWPATAIRIMLTGNFTHPAAREIFVVTPDEIKIYSLTEHGKLRLIYSTLLRSSILKASILPDSFSFYNKKTDYPTLNNHLKDELDCNGQYTHNRSTNEAQSNISGLILLFEDAQICICRFDPSTNCLKALSHHFYSEFKNLYSTLHPIPERSCRLHYTWELMKTLLTSCFHTKKSLFPDAIDISRAPEVVSQSLFAFRVSHFSDWIIFLAVQTNKIEMSKDILAFTDDEVPLQAPLESYLGKPGAKKRNFKEAFSKDHDKPKDLIPEPTDYNQPKTFGRSYIFDSSLDSDESWYISLSKDLGIEDAELKDMVFLDGTLEPTLALLIEDKPTQIGNSLSEEKGSIILLFVSIFNNTRDYHIIWKVDNLFQDSIKLITISQSVDKGVIVVSTDAIMVVPLFGYSFCQILNTAGVYRKDRNNISMPQFDQSELEIHLDGSSLAFIDTQTLLLSAHETGSLYYGHLIQSNSAITDILWSPIETNDQSNSLGILEIPSDIICPMPHTSDSTPNHYEDENQSWGIRSVDCSWISNLSQRPRNFYVALSGSIQAAIGLSIMYMQAKFLPATRSVIMQPIGPEIINKNEVNSEHHHFKLLRENSSTSPFIPNENQHNFPPILSYEKLANHYKNKVIEHISLQEIRDQFIPKKINHEALMPNETIESHNLSTNIEPQIESINSLITTDSEGDHHQGIKSFDLACVESLLCLGMIRSISTLPNSALSLSARPIESNSFGSQSYACLTGYEGFSHIHFLQKSVPTKSIESFEIPNASLLWSFEAVNQIRHSLKTNSTNTSYFDLGTIQDHTQSTPITSEHRYLLASSDPIGSNGNSCLIKLEHNSVGIEIYQDPTETAFLLNEPTVGSGTVLDGQILIQVTRTTIRLISGYDHTFLIGQVIFIDPSLVDNSTPLAVRAIVIDPYILILTNDMKFRAWSFVSSAAEKVCNQLEMNANPTLSKSYDHQTPATKLKTTNFDAFSFLEEITMRVPDEFQANIQTFSIFSPNTAHKKGPGINSRNVSVYCVFVSFPSQDIDIINLSTMCNIFHLTNVYKVPSILISTHKHKRESFTDLLRPTTYFCAEMSPDMHLQQDCFENNNVDDMEPDFLKETSILTAELINLDLSNDNTPTLIIIVSGRPLLIYKAFSFTDNSGECIFSETDNEFPYRFSLHIHNQLSTYPYLSHLRKKHPNHPNYHEDKDSKRGSGLPFSVSGLTKAFSNIGNHSGAFIIPPMCTNFESNTESSHPPIFWLLSKQNEIYIHPHNCKETISATPFNIDWQPNSFFCIDQNSKITFSEIGHYTIQQDDTNSSSISLPYPDDTHNLYAPLPIRSVPLGFSTTHLAISNSPYPFRMSSSHKSDNYPSTHNKGHLIAISCTINTNEKENFLECLNERNQEQVEQIEVENQHLDPEMRNNADELAQPNEYIHASSSGIASQVSRSTRIYEILVFHEFNFKEPIFFHTLKPLEEVSSMQFIWNNDREQLVVGTATNLSEFVESQGKLSFLNIPNWIDHSNNDTQGQEEDTSISSKPIGGPVLAMARIPNKSIDPSKRAPLSDYIIHSAGHKLFVHDFEGPNFEKGAFIELPTCVTHISVIKDYLIVGDYYKGVHFILWKHDSEADSRTLHALSSTDPRSLLPVITTAPMVYGTKLGIACSDIYANGWIFSYNHDKMGPDNEKMEVLKLESFFTLGSQITHMNHLEAPNNNKGLLGVTNEGSIFSLLPISSKDFNLLQPIQTALNTVLPPPLGIRNHKVKHYGEGIEIDLKTKVKSVIEINKLRELSFLSFPLLNFLNSRSSIDSSESFHKQLKNLSIDAKSSFNNLFQATYISTINQ